MKYFAYLRSRYSCPEMQWKPDDGVRYGPAVRMANGSLEISRFGEWNNHGRSFINDDGSEQ